MKTIFRFAFLILLVLVVFAVGCDSGSAIGGSIADVTIRNFKEQNAMIAFDILVEPKEHLVVPGDVYSVVLMANDGYLFAHYEIMWLESDFKASLANERNVGMIAEAKKRKLRIVSLMAPPMDKAIFPMRQELSQLRKDREQKALRDGGITVRPDIWTGVVDYDLGKYEITESDYQKIARKYVRVVVMTYDGWLKLKGEGVK